MYEQNTFYITLDFESFLTIFFHFTNIKFILLFKWHHLWQLFRIAILRGIDCRDKRAHLFLLSFCLWVIGITAVTVSKAACFILQHNDFETGDNEQNVTSLDSSKMRISSFSHNPQLFHFVSYTSCFSHDGFV